MKFVVRTDGQKRVVHVERENGTYRVTLGERVLVVDARTLGDPDTFSLLIDQRSFLVEAAPVRPEHGDYFARVMGRHYDVEVLDELMLAVRDAEKQQEQSGPLALKAPMPGLVVEVKVAEGDRVETGQALVVMEAMKMRNELSSDVAGTVTRVEVTVGDKVDSQAPLVTIERDG
jgi:biotin carboxyl carrier protein